jgi:uncharacterized membrane protein
MKTVRTMFVGGLIFLVPFAMILLVFGKVFSVALRLAEPAEKMIPIESVAGVALADILAVAIILLACLLAGAVATSTRGQRIQRRIDGWLLNLIPRYAFVKSMTESIGGQKENTLTPVLVRFDDLSQIAFEVERGPDELVTVYLPGSPDPWSGSVAQVTADRIDVLAADFASVVRSLRKIGRGPSALIEPTSG